MSMGSLFFEFVWSNSGPLPLPVFNHSYIIIRLRSDAYPRTVYAHLVCGLDKYNEMFCQNLSVISKTDETAWFISLGKVQ